MATSSAVITAANLANWIPRVWAKDVLADVEKMLVTGARMDRSYESYARTGGNVIVVPHLAEITAGVVNTSQDMTLYNAIQNSTNISIDIAYDIGVIVDDINQLQTNPKYYEKVRSKLSYGLAKQVDINSNALFKGFDNQAGTINVALTEDTLIDAYTKLNLSDAPDEDRAWLFDPESIQDLMKLDYFVRKDYVEEGVVSKGYTGRQIMGAPVYRTTNLDTYSAGDHAAGYFQREALALVIQIDPKFESFRLPLQHADGISGMVLFGVKEMRGTYGCCINTRS